MAIKAKKIQPAKAEAIENAKKVLGEYNDFIFADYRGLTVEQITTLRDKLREKNAVLEVMKNNFARIAFEDMKVENVADYLKGPTVIAMAKEDANEVAKVLFDFAKDAPTLTVKGAYVEKEVYDAAKIEAFSKRNDAAVKLSGCFAAKEAVSKALGTGVRGFTLREVELLRDELGKPYYVFSGKAADIMEDKKLLAHVSVTDEGDSVIVFTVLETA